VIIAADSDDTKVWLGEPSGRNTRNSEKARIWVMWPEIRILAACAARSSPRQTSWWSSPPTPYLGLRCQSSSSSASAAHSS